MITYDQQNKFYNQALEIVEKMGGRISAHGNLHGVFLSVIVFHDSTYEKTRSIMDTLQELYGGEIQYHEYWVSKGFIPHSQASLENIDENKVLEIIKEELTHVIHFLEHNVDAKNPVELNSFFNIIKQIIQENQFRIVKALMEELCAEKNMDYDEYILNTMFRKISENGQFKEIMDLMTKL